MERKNLQRGKPKKSGLFQSCFVCVSESKSTEFKTVYEKSSKSSRFDNARHHSPVRRSSARFFIDTELTLEDLSLKNSQAYNKKFSSEIPFQTKVSPPFQTRVNPTNELDKKKKDELVKSILGKYLAVKRQELINNNAKTEKKVLNQFPKLESDKNSLKVECIDDDSGTLVLGPSQLGVQINKKTGSCFPIKTKSAPTNSVANDSLADICTKMNSWHQQRRTISKTKYPKQLELEFNGLPVPFQNKKPCALEYKISCEGTPLVVGMLKTDEMMKRWRAEP